jgi:two-component system, chemotaxis family, protein-glutamate methylesterase/glutaminase
MTQPVHRDIFVIGGSAGALEALNRILSLLDPEVGASVFVVIHTGPGPSLLSEVISRRSNLTTLRAEDQMPIEPGRVYVASPDRHLLLKRSMLRVIGGPKENGFRPAIDPLFRSAARSHGDRVAGIVLSGARDDGTIGLKVIKQHGGAAIVQHPDDAQIPTMPLSAIRNTEVDRILPAAEIAELIKEWARPTNGKQPTSHGGNGPEDVLEIPSEG